MASQTDVSIATDSRRADTALIQIACGGSLIGTFITALVLLSPMLVIENTTGLIIAVGAGAAMFSIGATFIIVGTIYLARH